MIPLTLEFPQFKDIFRPSLATKEFESYVISIMVTRKRGKKVYCIYYANDDLTSHGYITHIDYKQFKLKLDNNLIVKISPIIINEIKDFVEEVILFYA